MLLIRFLLIGLIIYMIVRSVSRYSNEENHSPSMMEPEKGSDLTSKKVSKEVGEYIDYEDVDKLG